MDEIDELEVDAVLVPFEVEVEVDDLEVDVVRVLVEVEVEVLVVVVLVCPAIPETLIVTGAAS